MSAVTPASSASCGPSGNGKNPALAVLEDAEGGLLRQSLDRTGGIAGREQHFDEVLRDPRAEPVGYRPVEDRDAPERRHRVRRERALPRVLDRGADRDTARVRV